MSFIKARQKISDLFKERGVERVVYFHCDHFEPWSIVNGRRPVDPVNVEDICTFADQCKRIDFARSLTLFYKTQQNVAWDHKQDLIRTHEDEAFGFVPNTPIEEGLMRQGMKYLLDTVQHEIQVHIHHEGYTSSTRHVEPIPSAMPAHERDSARLTLGVRLAKEAILRETDIDLKEWFFVHGLWSLQGSDSSVCCIADEIKVLMKEGCKGDFTFPAGREHCNPSIEIPYFCEAISAIKGYDSPEACPEEAFGNRSAADKKFFVWASRIKASGSSLDYYDANVLRKLEQPELWAEQLIRDSYYVQGTLFLKTHAHSMQPEYREAARMLIPPHAHPGIQTLLGVCFDGAVQAGAEVKFSGASEVYELLVRKGAVWKSGDAAQSPQPASVPKVDALTVPTSTAEIPVLLAVASVRDLPPAEVKVQPIVEEANLDKSSITQLLTFPLTGAPGGINSQLANKAGLLNVTSRRVMADRIAHMGVLESGAYRHYARQIEKGELVGSLEVAVVDLLEILPGFSQFHEIRAGLGVLSMLIAATGRKSVAIEPDIRRFAAAEAIFKAISSELPTVAQGCTLFNGRFAELASGVGGQGALAILTDFLATIDECAVLDALRSYEGVLVDIDRFGTQRTTDEERHELLARMRDKGFMSIRPILDLGNQGRYYLISAQAPAPQSL